MPVRWFDLRRRLDACLVPGQPGMDITGWAALVDPFPTWKRADEMA